MTVARVAALLAVVLVACGMAWVVIAKTGATLIAASDPTAALYLNSTSAAALDAFATKQISAEEGNLDAAERSLHKALRHSPLDQQALFLLAEAARRKKDMAESDALMRMAGRRSWRNLAVQLSLVESELGKRQYGQALDHIDAAIRMAPELQYQDNHLLGVLTAYLLDPESLRSLEQFLGTAPPWREWFLQELCKRLVKPAPLDALYASLLASANPPSHRERLVYIGRLVKDRRYTEAQRQWLAELPGGLSARPASYPYNRDFKSAPDGSPFDWLIVARHGADVRLNGGADSGVLTAQFSGSRVDMLVSQLQLLPPGRYIFGGEVMAQNLHANRGVRWHLFCDGSSKQPLGDTELVASSMPWTQFSIQFEVPPQDCPAQWLQLEIPARVPSEHEIEGQISYRSLAIDPVDAKSGLQLLWRWPN